jgi:DNA-directed RNA polymerase subunit alpha
MQDLSIKCLKSKKAESGAIYGQFLINSLNLGQGVTIGNLLRRILLSEVGGCAITAVRIAGTTHEFSTLPGIREDILEILLNLKGIVLKSKTKETEFGRLKIKGPAVITADLIELPPNLEIINPNHYIATISDANFLEIEFKFEYGTGYKLAAQNLHEKSNDFLEIDAVFMPVQKVDFKIENVYDDLNEVTERLILEIWTNGSISPTTTIINASQFIISLFSSITKTTFIDEILESENDNSSLPIDPHTNIPIEELQLPVRAYNCLKRAQINTVGQLLKYSPEQLQEIKNFGRKSANEVFAALKNKLGITLT